MISIVSVCVREGTRKNLKDQHDEPNNDRHKSGAHTNIIFDKEVSVTSPYSISVININACVKPSVI